MPDPEPSDDELKRALARELKSMEDAVSSEHARLSKSPKTRGRGALLGVQQAVLRYAQGDLAGAIAILQKFVAHLASGKRAEDPYRYYMETVLAKWLAEAGDHAEAAHRLSTASVYFGEHPDVPYQDELIASRKVVETLAKRPST